MIEGKAIYKNYAINYFYKNKGLGIFLIIKIYDRYTDDNHMTQLYEIEFPVAYKNSKMEITNINDVFVVSVDDIVGIVRNYFIYKDMFNINRNIIIDDKEYDYYFVKTEDFSNDMLSHNTIEFKFREKTNDKNDIVSFVSKFVSNADENWSSIKLGAYISSNNYSDEDSITTEYLLISDIAKYSNEEEVESLIRENIETDEIYSGYLSESFI